MKLAFEHGLERVIGIVVIVGSESGVCQSQKRHYLQCLSDVRTVSRKMIPVWLVSDSALVLESQSVLWAAVAILIVVGFVCAMMDILSGWCESESFGWTNSVAGIETILWLVSWEELVYQTGRLYSLYPDIAAHLSAMQSCATHLLWCSFENPIS